MISSLRGNIVSIDSDTSKIVIDVNGIGYEVLLPTFVMRALIDRDKKEGDEIALQTYYHVTERQPRPLLVGFNSESEKRFFERLIGVEDLGPAKAAKAFIFSVSTVANAIEDGDAKLLQSMPGIGGRTAQKIIATLKEKVAEFALLKDEGYDNVQKPARRDISIETIEVLVGLGYRRTDAKAKVDAILEARPGLEVVEDLIREVFRSERK
ncbi:MAG: Holliday junction branch migration protein RuvA [Chloroflexota bacterium]|nr:Holliday junction branch migration protein RuvA [Chloroflexota bacterium]